MVGEAELRERIEALTGQPPSREFRVVDDTTEFMGILRGQVIRLGDRSFLVEGQMREGRFGLDDDPKYWVKKGLDLDTGERKVLKLVFLEEFRIRIGLLAVRCYRSPEKEAAVLDLVRGDPRYMQGVTIPDARGNPVRVLDLIPGESLYRYLKDLPVDHRTFFFTLLPTLLAKVVGCLEAIQHLHDHGLNHGDIRNDHVFVERGTGRLRWIDFDLTQDIADFDVWSLGNVLLFVVGKGEHTFHDVAAGRIRPLRPLENEDASAFFGHRIVNLSKVFDYIPRELNDILMHFSYGTDRFYESAADLLHDLRPVARDLAAPAGAHGAAVERDAG
jgi:hypothetical protein